MEIEEKKKRVKEYFRATEVGMMIEVLQDQMKMVAEDLSGFRDETKKRLDKIEKNQEVTLEYLFRIDDRLNEIEKELKEIKADMKRIDENNVDKDEFEILKTKIGEIEKELKRVIEWQKEQQKLTCA
jgi:hypothetical protein